MQSKCSVCGTHMIEAFSLGELYISNFVKEDSVEYPKSDLTMMVCPHCGTGKLKEAINPDLLYKENDYWYYSGVNDTMQAALKNVVDSVEDSIHMEPGDIWLDIACNDGTLMNWVPPKYCTCGIDPSNTVKEIKDERHSVVNDYFSEQGFRSVYGAANAKVISCIAMFYDLENPHQFLEDVRSCLRSDGVFVVQISYTPLMFHQSEFGNICAEHVMYYSLNGLKMLFEQHGLYIQDVELNDINGGSFRVYATKQQEAPHFRTPQKRDVAQFRMNSLLAHEQSNDVMRQFISFGERINKLKFETVDFINSELNAGKKVCGYGASTKGNTLLQYFGLDYHYIHSIGERNEKKWGLKTVGTHIPIVPEEEVRDADYLLVLPWHFIEEFKVRERAFLERGGKFIVPSPQFEVIGL